MSAQQVTVRARFDRRELVVIDRSPELPDSTETSLLPYLFILTLQGWKAVHGQFEGWEVVLTLEKLPGIPFQSTTTYLIPMLYQIPCPGGRVITAEHHKRMMNLLEDQRIRDGWEVLAGPKQFAEVGLWTIAIWMKS